MRLDPADGIVHDHRDTGAIEPEVQVCRLAHAAVQLECYTCGIGHMGSDEPGQCARAEPQEQACRRSHSSFALKACERERRQRLEILRGHGAAIGLATRPDDFCHAVHDVELCASQIESAPTLCSLDDLNAHPIGHLRRRGKYDLRGIGPARPPRCRVATVRPAVVRAAVGRKPHR